MSSGNFHSWYIYMIITLLFAIVLLLLGAHFGSSVGQIGGHGPTDFSVLDDYVGKGVPGSYANRINDPDPTKQMLFPTTDLLPTYYGHGIPLTPHDRKPGPLYGKPITPHHLNAKCSPECCPSPYSCDHGCLCVDQSGLRKGAWKSK